MTAEQVASVLAVMPRMDAISAKDIAAKAGLTHEETYRALVHLEAVGSAQVTVQHENGQVARALWERS